MRLRNREDRPDSKNCSLKSQNKRICFHSSCISNCANSIVVFWNVFPSQVALQNFYEAINALLELNQTRYTLRKTLNKPFGNSLSFSFRAFSAAPLIAKQLGSETGPWIVGLAAAIASSCWKLPETCELSTLRQRWDAICQPESFQAKYQWFLKPYHHKLFGSKGKCDHQSIAFKHWSAQGSIVAQEVAAHHLS